MIYHNAGIGNPALKFLFHHVYCNSRFRILRQIIVHIIIDRYEIL